MWNFVLFNHHATIWFLQKPDGCVVIEQHEIPHRLLALKLRDLNGIGRQMEARLAHYGISTVEPLYAANKDQLRTAWGNVEGERMYDKLRGLEPHYVKNARSSLGHSHVLPPEQRFRSTMETISTTSECTDWDWR